MNSGIFTVLPRWVLVHPGHLGALPYTKVMFPTVETSVGAVLYFYEEALVPVLRIFLLSTLKWNLE
jgi:hypothetical protein